MFRYNKIYSNVGADVRLGEDTYADGVNNEVYGNELLDNQHSALKLQTWPQGKICGNLISGSIAVRGDATNELTTDPTAACP